MERGFNHHNLNNLLWVWSPNAPAEPYENYFHGLEYVDILAADIYHNNYKQSNYGDLLKISGGKPIALGEVGDVPTSEILDKQPRWVWFMTWSGFEGISPEVLRKLYNDPRTLILDDVKISYKL